MQGTLWPGGCGLGHSYLSSHPIPYHIVLQEADFYQDLIFWVWVLCSENSIRDGGKSEMQAQDDGSSNWWTMQCQSRQLVHGQEQHHQNHSLRRRATWLPTTVFGNIGCVTDDRQTHSATRTCLTNTPRNAELILDFEVILQFRSRLISLFL